MKKRILTILLSAVFLTSYTQSIEPVDGMIKHNDSDRPCLVVKLDPSEKELENAWADYLKSKYNVKLGSTGFLGTGNLFEAKAVIVSTISPKTMDFYSNIKELGDETELKVFGAFGYDMYVSPTETPDAYAAMKRMIKEFLADYLPNYYQNLIEGDQKKLNKLEKTEAKLSKSLEKNQKKIDKLTKTIEAETAEKEETLTKKSEVSERLKTEKARLENVLKQLNK